MEDLGEQLRRHREQRCLTLEEISNWTKINLSYLEHLEAGRFDCLPAPVFVLGFLKQVAQCVGLDPEEVVSNYRAALRKEVGSTHRLGVARKGVSRRQTLFIMVLFMCGAILLWVFLYPRPPSNGERVRSIRLPRTSSEEIRKEQLRRELNLQLGSQAGIPAHNELPVPSVPKEGTGNREADKGYAGGLPVALTLQALRKTWVEVTVDDLLPALQDLDAGDHFSYQAEQRVLLNIGNGDGVRVFFNGKVFENLGKADEVVQILFPPPDS